MSKATQGFPFLVLVLMLIAAIPALTESKADHHLTNDRARSLYWRSAYVHGYIHGYEDGFHYANIDLNMAHEFRKPSDFKEFRSGTCGYRSDFGDKKYFKRGYQQGFRQGYTDGTGEWEFRAVFEARKAAAGLPQPEQRKRPSIQFDEGFSKGYEAGRENGAFRSTSAITPGNAAEHCETIALGSPYRGEYCDGYVRGFGMGYSDEIITQQILRTQRAKK